MAASETTIARAAVARRNEDLVLAESGLVIQRMVGWVRLAMLLLFGLSQGIASLAGVNPNSRDAGRVVAVALYLVSTIVNIVQLRRAKPSPVGALWGPLGMRVMDFGFMVFMATRSWDADHLALIERSAGSFAVALCFAVGSYRGIQVVISTVMACAAITFVTWYNHTANFSMVTFLWGCYIALGILLFETSRHVRTNFVNLRKRDNLSRMLPPQIVERAMHLEASLAPTSREVTVLFSDIRNFTTLSESMDPRLVLEFLDEYFSHMQQIVKGRSGIVNKFLGDGMLAFWGVPDRAENHAELATRAAIDMRRKLAELNGHWEREGRKPIAIGVGIHTGVVAAGLLGGADQHEYTVIGDAVNVASRVEGLTKTFGVDILLTEDTAKQLHGRIECVRVGEEKVKGRERPVTVYAVGQSI